MDEYTSEEIVVTGKRIKEYDYWFFNWYSNGGTQPYFGSGNDGGGGGGGSAPATDPDTFVNEVTVTFTPTPAQQALIDRFKAAVERARAAVDKLPDHARIELKDGRVVTGAEYKALFAKADFIIDDLDPGKPEQNYRNGTQRGEADPNNGDPRIRLEIDLLAQYERDYGEAGLNYLPLHEVGHTTQAGQSHWGKADQEIIANDIAKAVADYGGLAVPPRLPEGSTPGVSVDQTPTYVTFGPVDYATFYSVRHDGYTYHVPPVILDLDGDGLELIAPDQTSFRFDFDGDGKADAMGWVAGDDGILAFDGNGNGLVDGPWEYVFGANGLGGFQSDLEALEFADSNGDGLLNADDEHFDQFLVWQDRNQDGVSQFDETGSLDFHRIASISLQGTSTGNTFAGATDNVVLATTHYTMASGEVRVAGDVVLALWLSSLAGEVVL